MKPSPPGESNGFTGNTMHKSNDDSLSPPPQSGSADEDSQQEECLPLLIGSELRQLYYTLFQYARYRYHALDWQEYLQGFLEVKLKVLSQKFARMKRSEFIAYSKTSFRHYVIDQMRKQRAIPSISKPPEHFNRHPVPPRIEMEIASEHRAFLTKNILQEIQKLPPIQRKIITAYYLDNPPSTCSEIAEELDLTVSNVRVILFRARSSLTKRCDKYTHLYYDLY
jgi:RNA polymerase sigma factor (sigma-70 family)